MAGLEASGYSAWFVGLLGGLGHQVWLGDASEIRRRARRRQENDRRGAELIPDLLRREEFPRIHYPPLESRETLRLLRYRHGPGRMRTRARKSLQALAFGAGWARRAQLLSRKGRGRLSQSPMSAAMGRQRVSGSRSSRSPTAGSRAWTSGLERRPERMSGSGGDIE